MCMQSRSYLSRVTAVLLFSLAFIFASHCSAQTPRRQSAAVDPHGRPMPSREQQRARLEQLLGRPVQDYPIIQTGPAGVAAAPFDGADNPVAYTSANPEVLVQPTPDD